LERLPLAWARLAACAVFMLLGVATIIAGQI
jgi:hypothetical protein